MPLLSVPFCRVLGKCQSRLWKKSFIGFRKKLRFIQSWKGCSLRHEVRSAQVCVHMCVSSVPSVGMEEDKRSRITVAVSYDVLSILMVKAVSLSSSNQNIPFCCGELQCFPAVSTRSKILLASSVPTTVSNALVRAEQKCRFDSSQTSLNGWLILK